LREEDDECIEDGWESMLTSSSVASSSCKSVWIFVVLVVVVLAATKLRNVSFMVLLGEVLFLLLLGLF